MLFLDVSEASANPRSSQIVYAKLWEVCNLLEFSSRRRLRLWNKAKSRFKILCFEFVCPHCPGLFSKINGCESFGIPNWRQLFAWLRGGDLIGMLSRIAIELGKFPVQKAPLSLLITDLFSFEERQLRSTNLTTVHCIYLSHLNSTSIPAKLCDREIRNTRCGYFSSRVWHTTLRGVRRAEEGLV